MYIVIYSYIINRVHLHPIQMTGLGWEPLLKTPPNNGSTSINLEPLGHNKNLAGASKYPSVLSSVSEEPLKCSLALF